MVRSRERTDDSGAPPMRRWVRELPYLALIAASPWRRVEGKATRSADRPKPVLVFPGIMSSDSSTSLLRRTLNASGYCAHSSKLGFVTGITPGSFARALERLAEIAEAHGTKVTLIGWSLGGFYARVLAQRRPDLVEMVVTLGTPFSGNRHANNAWRLYNLLNDHTVDAPAISDDPSIKPAVPTIALWSPNDGVVSPASSRGLPDERDEAIEVPYRHFAMATDRGAIAEIVEVLDANLGD